MWINLFFLDEDQILLDLLVFPFLQVYLNHVGDEINNKSQFFFLF